MRPANRETLLYPSAVLIAGSRARMDVALTNDGPVTIIVDA
jgi:D-Tyr-tRNAtyr deacylase